MASAIGSVVGGIGGSFIGMPQVGAALGGALGGAIGGSGGSSGGGTPATGTTSANLPGWLASPYSQQVSQAQSLGQTPYNPAMNQQVAGFNPQQQQAFGLTNQLVGQYQQPFNQALQQTGQLGQQAVGGLNNPQFQSYMNPYIQNVLNTSNQQSFQNLGIAQNQLNEQAAGSGAFGNSRLGLAQGQLTSNALMNMNSQNAQILGSGFNTALQGYQTGIGQGLNASNQLGNLATGQQATGLQGINALYGAGAAQQGLQQQQYNAGQFNAMQQAQYPWQQLANQQSIMSAPAQIYGKQQISTQTPAQLSPGMQGLQTGMSLFGAGASGGIGGLMNAPSNYLNSGNESTSQLLNQINSNSTGAESLTPTGNTGWGSLFNGLFNDGGVVGYAKGGGVNAKEAVGAPGFFHLMNAYTPHMKGFRQGGHVDPSSLEHGFRTGGLLHKAPKGKAPKGSKQQGLAALQALSQLSQAPGAMGTPGAGMMPPQGLPSPSMGGIAAPGAQQPQIGLMTGGMVPHSIAGYAHGGVPMKMEHGVNACYADGGQVDPVSQALTNPYMNPNTLGEQIAYQKAQNYVNQLLGQGQGGLPQGYRQGGIVGYDDGGDVSYAQQGANWLVNNYPGMANSMEALGQNFQNAGFTPGWDANPLSNALGVTNSYNSYATQHPMASTIAGLTLPVSAIGSGVAGAMGYGGDALLGAAGYGGRALAGAEGMGPSLVRGAVGAGALMEPTIAQNIQNAPNVAAQKLITQAQQDALTSRAAQQKAMAAQQGSTNPATADITQADIDFVNGLNNTASAPQQQGPMGPFGFPMNMSAAAFAAGMTNGAGHGNSGALAAGVGGAEQQAMQQRQFDALAGLRQSQIGLNQAKAQGDIGNLQLKQGDAPWKIALQQAQAQNAASAPQARAQQAIGNLMKNYMQSPDYMTNPQGAYAKAMQDFQQNPQGVMQMFGQQPMQGLPPGFVPRTQ